MIKENICINVYSELNEWIDFCITVNDLYNLQAAKEIIDKAYDEWFNNDICEPIADYICRSLEDKKIEFEIYFKEEQLEDESSEIQELHKFVVGNTYTTEDWTIGGTIFYEVKQRDGNEILLTEHLDNVDGIFDHDCGWYDVFMENGTEYVILGSLFGHEHRLYAED